MYSLIWTNRNVRPSANVDTIPAFSPNRLPFRTDMSAQCSVSDEDRRMAVFMPATASGTAVPGAGHGSGFTMRMKKYAVKNAPKIMISEMMKSAHPERRRLHARGAVRGRRSVVLVGDRRGFHAGS